MPGLGKSGNFAYVAARGAVYGVNKFNQARVNGGSNYRVLIVPIWRPVELNMEFTRIL